MLFVSPMIYAQGMWHRWYHVLVEAPDGKRHLIAVEATSALQARDRVAADWGEKRVLEVKSLR